jgi:DNA-binding beta-propeller fold protein YncE
VGRILLEDIAVDPKRRNLFVPNGRQSKTVTVFDLKTLKSKGTLDFAVDYAPTASGETVRFIFPAAGNAFFARWWNENAAGGNGAFEVATINARTFKTTAQRATTPPLAEKLMLGSTGRTLYSMTERKPAHIDVFDLPGFTRNSSIDLEAFVNPGAFSRSIHDFGGGKLLFAENIKVRRADPNRFSLFVYDLASHRITPKIQTGFAGESRLLPQSNRVLFNERTDLTLDKSMVRSGVDFVYPGQVHVYDATTGNRVATVAVSGVHLGSLLAASPKEDMCYYFSQDVADQERKLSVIDLRSYTVVKELPLRRSDIRMIPFDE